MMKYLEIFSYIAPIRSNNHSTGRITSPKILVLGGQSVFVVYFDGEACSLYVHTCIPFIYEHCCIRIICMSWSEGEKKEPEEEWPEAEIVSSEEQCWHPGQTPRLVK